MNELSPIRAIAWMARVWETSLGELDMSLPQYRTLTFLSEGDSAASRLADHMAVSRPSVTALVDGLVARGLVERRHGQEDRRRVLHVITDDGRTALAAADATLAAALDNLGEGLTAADRRAFDRGLSQILDTMRQRKTAAAAREEAVAR